MHRFPNIRSLEGGREGGGEGGGEGGREGGREEGGRGRLSLCKLSYQPDGY